MSKRQRTRKRYQASLLRKPRNKWADCQPNDNFDGNVHDHPENGYFQDSKKWFTLWYMTPLNSFILAWYPKILLGSLERIFWSMKNSRNLSRGLSSNPACKHTFNYADAMFFSHVVRDASQKIGSLNIQRALIPGLRKQSQAIAEGKPSRMGRAFPSTTLTNDDENFMSGIVVGDAKPLEKARNIHLDHQCIMRPIKRNMKVYWPRTATKLLQKMAWRLLFLTANICSICKTIITKGMDSTIQFDPPTTAYIMIIRYKIYCFPNI